MGLSIDHAGKMGGSYDGAHPVQQLKRNVPLTTAIIGGRKFLLRFVFPPVKFFDQFGKRLYTFWDLQARFG